MRQRLVNEKAVSKTLAFLKAIHQISNSPVVKPLGIFYKEFNVSKATGSACKKLNIFSDNGDGGYDWFSPEPTREIALQVLEVLRLRNDKMVSMPLEGFESLVDTLQSLVIALKPKADSSRTVGNYQKQIEDKKQDDLLKIACAISAGMYSDIHNAKHDVVCDIYDKNKVSNLNEAIVFAAKDLLTKIYK